MPMSENYHSLRRSSNFWTPFPFSLLPKKWMSLTQSLMQSLTFHERRSERCSFERRSLKLWCELRILRLITKGFDNVTVRKYNTIKTLICNLIGLDWLQIWIWLAWNILVRQFSTPYSVVTISKPSIVKTFRCQRRPQWLVSKSTSLYINISLE